MDLDLITPLNIADAADHQVGGKSPGLRLVIPDIHRLQAGLFHHLAPHRIFDALPDLNKACDQRRAREGLDECQDDGEPFEEKMARLTSELSDMFKKSHELEDEIRKKLGAIGYEI